MVDAIAAALQFVEGRKRSDLDTDRMLVFALGPSTDVAVIDLPSKRTVELTVEHFQIGGRAVLELVLEPT